MKVEKTKLDGVLLITPSTVFEDFRGYYVETYNKEAFLKHGINVDFLEDDISTSRKKVLRGIHGDKETWKLVSCLYGSFYIIIVNNDSKSKQYKQWTSFTISDRNRLQILIPPKFGNGHLVLSDITIFHYKQSTNYNRLNQFTIKWNDPNYDFKWPIKNPILSKRDT
tara:strand:+ start:291 stop:791 length:501 start_codon:yes stop_codon:yes gene_type:complete